MEKEQIERINELARKKKTVGLTDAELQEQAALRKQYIAEWRANMESVLQSVVILHEDGSQTHLQKKRPN